MGKGYGQTCEESGIPLLVLVSNWRILAHQLEDSSTRCFPLLSLSSHLQTAACKSPWVPAAIPTQTVWEGSVLCDLRCCPLIFNFAFLLAVFLLEDLERYKNKTEPRNAPAWILFPECQKYSWSFYHTNNTCSLEKLKSHKKKAKKKLSP